MSKTIRINTSANPVAIEVPDDITVTEVLDPGPVAMTGGNVDFCSTTVPSSGTYVLSATMYYQPGAAGDGGLVRFRVNGVLDNDSSINFNDATFGGCIIPIALHKKYTSMVAGQTVMLRGLATAGSAIVSAVLHLMRIS